MFRVVGVDTFEAWDADYLIEDTPSLERAKKLADKHGEKWNPVYVYNDKGEMVYHYGSA